MTSTEIAKSTNQVEVTTSEPEVLVEVSNVSKKFARRLMTSLKYGAIDILREVLGLPLKETLRKNEFWAVKDVSFTLRRGECLGLIGHNGAGKSTLLKMLNGLIKPDAGSIKMRGRVAALIELGAGFNPILTGRENIYVNGQILGFTRKEIDAKFQDIVDFAEIGEFIDTPVQNFSSGMKVRLGFAVAAQMEPDVLIIDEVLAVGDLGFRVKCLNRMSQLLQNSAVIFVSHSMPMIARIASNGILMKRGQTILCTNDVGQIINYYNEEFGSGKYLVTGNGDMWVLNPFFIQKRTELHLGESIELTFEIHSKRFLENISVRVVVFNADQRPVYDFVDENLDPYILKIVDGPQTINLRSRPLLLAAGKHSITIILQDENKTVLHRADNILIFNMAQDLSTGAESFYIANWSKKALNK
ncbi:MAG: polysaccharide ABC transporter ATP-binding protein [Bacteroidota bacterium]